MDYKGFAVAPLLELGRSTRDSQFLLPLWTRSDYPCPSATFWDAGRLVNAAGHG